MCAWFQPRCWRGANFVQRGSHSLTLINECPARASYRLELKRPSPQARHRTTDRTAVAYGYIKSRYNTVRATAPSRVHIYCHRLKVTGENGQGMSVSGKMLPESLGLRACCPFGGRAWNCRRDTLETSRVAKHPHICRHRWNPNRKRARNCGNILYQQNGHTIKSNS